MSSSRNDTPHLTIIEALITTLDAEQQAALREKAIATIDRQLALARSHLAVLKEARSTLLAARARLVSHATNRRAKTATLYPSKE